MLKKLGLAAAGLGIVTLGGIAAYGQYQESLEGPDYEIETKDGDIEVRRYAAMLVAEVWAEGTREQASSRSFRRLAAYIFADDRGGEEIAMTSPVIQDTGEEIAMTTPVMQDEGSDGRWRMRFVMPAQYTLETLPSAPSDVTLTEVPSRRMAAIRFAGNGHNASLAEREAELRDWMTAHDLKAAGGAEYAFYDPPMVPGRLRRNEVMIPIE